MPKKGSSKGATALFSRVFQGPVFLVSAIAGLGVKMSYVPVRKLEMVKMLCAVFAAAVVLSSPVDSASKKTKNAAAVGAGVGLVTGGVSGAAKGAVLGGGAGAYADADKGDKAKKYARNTAAVGAGVGLLTDGVSGAAKGAVYGAAAGAMAGEHKDRK